MYRGTSQEKQINWMNWFLTRSEREGILGTESNLKRLATQRLENLWLRARW